MSATHFQFGKYRINVAKLKSNILSVSSDKKKHVWTTIIGEKVQTLLLDYKDHNKFNITAYNELSKEQKEIINLLLYKSGMDDTLGIRIKEEELPKLIDRYELLRGQILAGQDSLEVRKELRNVVLKLVKLNKLPLKQSYDLLLELTLLDH
jgi:hypothetical protein